jgi:hypothetical protein
MNFYCCQQPDALINDPRILTAQVDRRRPGSFAVNHPCLKPRAIIPRRMNALISGSISEDPGIPKAPFHKAITFS